MDIERVEKLLNIKVIGFEAIKGRRVFPLFDLAEVKGIRKGIKLALIANPSFLIIDEEDVREKKVEGEFVVVQKEDDEYLLIKYTGTPNIEALREAEEAEQKEEVEKQEAEEDKGGDGDDDPVKEILRKLPKWSDGAVIIEKDVVLPVKRSTKKDGFYASATWKPLKVRGVAEELIGHLITRDGKVIKTNIYVGKYINITIPRRGGKSGRRR
jgi:hypothetical protein